LSEHNKQLEEEKKRTVERIDGSLCLFESSIFNQTVALENDDGQDFRRRTRKDNAEQQANLDKTSSSIKIQSELFDFTEVGKGIV
jgi:hypothetical protein